MKPGDFVRCVSQYTLWNFVGMPNNADDSPLHDLGQLIIGTIAIVISTCSAQNILVGDEPYDEVFVLTCDDRIGWSSNHAWQVI